MLLVLRCQLEKLYLKYMKFFLTFLFILIGLQFLFTAPVLAADEAPMTVRVGVYDNHPKIYRDEQGEIKGLWADIVDYIAAEEGWDLQYVHGNWAEGLERLENNEIDIMVDVALSEERREKYDFTDVTMLINWAAVYSRKGINIQSIMDFEGADIAVMKKGIHFSGPLGLNNLLDSFAMEANFIDVGVYADVFELLHNKEADIGVVNRIFGISNEDKYDVVRTTVVFNPIELRFALTKDSPQNVYLIETLDYHLVKLKMDQNSVYHESIRTHLKGFTEEVEVKVFPSWAKVLLWILGGTLLSSLIVAFFMKRHQKKLKKEIEEGVVELRKSYEKLKELDRLKDNFLNTTSHELKTPLIPIKAQTELLLAGDYGQLNIEQRKALGTIFRNEEQLERLVKNILDIAKAKSRELKLVLKDVALAEIITDAMRDVEKFARTKEVSLIIKPMSEIPKISIDKKQIFQVVSNLLDNALKFAPEKSSVTVEVQKKENDLVVSIEDAGIGMSKETMEKIFTPFFQAESGVARKYGGTGAGLAICKEIIEAHGGKIWAESQGEGKGSVFSFSLPKGGGKDGG